LRASLRRVFSDGWNAIGLFFADRHQLRTKRT
jgi:hypothetical protein